MGLTKWDLSDAEVTRSSFLKEAVSKSYKAREDASSVGSPSNSSASSSRSSLNDQSSQSSTTSSDKPVQHHRARQAAFAAELRNQRTQPRNVTYTSFADERPISSYTVVMNGLDGLTQHHQQARPPLSPPPHAPIPQVYAPGPNPNHGPGPVLDPVDRAIDLIVRELGFNENNAKWALKITDTGEGINTDAAVSLLIRESQARTAKRGWLFSSSQPKEGSLMESAISEDGIGWRWA